MFSLVVLYVANFLYLLSFIENTHSLYFKYILNHEGVAFSIMLSILRELNMNETLL